MVMVVSPFDIAIDFRSGNKFHWREIYCAKPSQTWLLPPSVTLLDGWMVVLALALL